MNIARQLGLFNAPYQGTSTFVKLPDQAPTSARSEFLKRLVAEGDEEEEEEEKVPAPAAAAAVVAAPAAATATAAAATGGVPDLAVDDVAEVKEVKEVWRPPVWPEPNENIRTAIADMYGEVDAILGEKREGWPAKLRQLVTTQLVPLGWESDYPPDRTTVSKVLFLASKTLYEKDFNNQDLLSEGRTLAERAFEDEGDLEAGKMLKAYAALYAANGDEDAEQMILDDFARIIKTKGYPEDLVPVPTAPEYGFKDKWTISILEPPAMGGEAIEVMVRPKQKFRVLANAWLKMKDLTEENLGDYEFVVPEMPKTWRSGKIDLEDEIGDTGILDGNGFSVVITNPDVEMALMSAQA